MSLILQRKQEEWEGGGGWWELTRHINNSKSYIGAALLLFTKLSGDIQLFVSHNDSVEKEQTSSSWEIKKTEKINCN